MAAGAQVGLEGAFSFSARSLSDASRCSINAIPMQHPEHWESQHMDARSVDTVPRHEKLSVTVVKAERLVRLDHTHRDLLGTYVELCVHGPHGHDEVQRTTIDDRAMSWEDQRYDFELTEWTDIRRAKLQLSLRAVWQGDGVARSETLVGECGLSLSNLSGERSGAVERRLRLGDGAGELVVRCELDRHMPRVLRSETLHREASPRGRFLALPGRDALEESERAAELVDLPTRSYRRSPSYTTSKQRHRARFSTPSRATRRAAPSPSLRTRYSHPASSTAAAPYSFVVCSRTGGAPASTSKRATTAAAVRSHGRQWQSRSLQDAPRGLRLPSRLAMRLWSGCCGRRWRRVSV